jgi:RNA polymerase sigma-70 factor (TIGR02957 family)
VTDEEAFEANRELLFAVAYRMLGTVADAEDAVQDAWLRWVNRPRPDVTQPRAYLVKTVTHLALNRLRSAQARREAYVGPWLPEPLLTATPDAAGRAELAESVSLAMLVVLESLTPEERAVFVLHEVFGFTHVEIAAAIGRTGTSVRQLMHRAREHVQARRPRFDVDAGQQREVTERFLAAAAGGDIDQLMMVLAPDVTLIADGGGQAKAPLRPITGATKVARFLAAVSRRPYGGADVSDMVVETAEINGGPGTVITAGGKPIAAVTTVIAGGRISAIHVIANPDKLQGLGAGRTLSW